MDKKSHKIIPYAMTAVIVAAAVIFAYKYSSREKQRTPDEENKKEAEYIASGQDKEIATVEAHYSEIIEYPALAEFLAEYYQIPEEELEDTRYYYNYCDVNDDGADEIFAVVIGEYTKQDAGNPALILSVPEDGKFSVLASFAAIQTPVLISEGKTNGWNDLLFRTQGRGVRTGFQLWRYTEADGYQTGDSGFYEEQPLLSGTQILSNNLIDDMDRGRYLTLAPEAEAGSGNAEK